MTKNFINNKGQYCQLWHQKGNNNLTFTVDKQSKTIEIKESYKYTYEIKKSFINASGGAEGLFNWICKCIDENFMMIFVNKIFETIVNQQIKATF